MFAPRSGVLRAICLSAALLGGVSAVITLGLAESAYAREGNGNAGGNGKGQGNGRSGGSENGSANAGERSEGKGGKSAGGNAGERGGNGGTSFSGSDDSDDDAAPVSGEKPKKAGKSEAAGGKGNKLAQALGVHPSELGALNAANASSRALANAAPGSRVGRIAAYRDAVLVGQQLEAEYADAVAVLEGLTAPDQPSTEIAGDLEQAKEDQLQAESELKELEGALEEAATEDEANQIQNDIDALEKEIAERETLIGELKGELDAATEYEAAQGVVEDLEAQLDEQAALETSLLEAAANKPVTESVEKAVQQLLGIN